ncbi:Nuclear fragile X mental retardation-interacting protein 1 [Habropoda laboriosa]|uniref:Nuclear fragile X mental retardation-interacting protein 1 n=2 Tax=Habropoda laboriosa TaxID=597456 RepID=A0A0L7R5K6_9HYME|nr:Nuclear fragile X mental retardation-interacting protein 1 [Habropoda laboriosa]
MQHNSGLYHKIKNISTPEDIEKWIMERKKRYPTKANIELRKAEELEKVQRGEIIKQKQHVIKRKKKKLLRSYKRKRIVHKQSTEISCDIIEKTQTYRGLHEFSGTLSLKNENLHIENQSTNETENYYEESINHISDEEEIPVALPKFAVATSNVVNLVANYESSVEDNDAPEEISIKRVKLDDDITIEESNAVEELTNKNEVIDKTYLSTKFSNPQLTDSGPKASKNKHNIALHRNAKNKDQKTTINKRQPYTSQLLQKLLSRSIQHERNLICQCIKYIVDNNYFD